MSMLATGWIVFWIGSKTSIRPKDPWGTVREGGPRLASLHALQCQGASIKTPQTLD